MEGYIASINTSFIEIPGVICTSVFMTGCSFNCHNCQNKSLQLLTNGQCMTVNEIKNSINDNKLARWVCFIGGEPFYQPQFLFEICHQIDKPIGIYTGNDYNILIQHPIYQKIISLPNVLFLKTGRFIDELMNIDEYPITKNQQVRLKIDNEWVFIPSRNIQDIQKRIRDLNI